MCARRDWPNPNITTRGTRMPTVGKLFFNMGVFALVTFLIYLSCMAMVRIEDRKQARRRRNS